MTELGLSTIYHTRNFKENASFVVSQDFSTVHFSQCIIPMVWQRKLHSLKEKEKFFIQMASLPRRLLNSSVKDSKKRVRLRSRSRL